MTNGFGRSCGCFGDSNDLVGKNALPLSPNGRSNSAPSRRVLFNKEGLCSAAPTRYSRGRAAAEDDSEPAEQGSDGRRCEIGYCRVPTSRVSPDKVKSGLFQRMPSRSQGPITALQWPVVVSTSKFDVMLSEHRDLAAAQAFFRSAKAVTGFADKVQGIVG